MTAETRREFIRKMLAAGCFAVAAPGLPLSLLGATEKNPDLVYRYSTLPVKRLKDMKKDIDRLIRWKKLSTNKTYMDYLDHRDYEFPKDFKEAKSIIVMATFTKMMYVDFHLDGKRYELIVPPQYYDDGVTIEDLKGVIQKEIIGKSGYRVERATGPLLKNLAVRSGLAKYGRNNIAYVDGMGSFLTLYAFFTDYDFGTDPWTDIKNMDRCNSCRICMKFCPNRCIRPDNFIIDVDRCVTLYNEVKGEFPGWMTPESHTALIGCMMCQMYCPMNHEALKVSGRLEAVPEEITRQILEGEPDDKLIEAVKLRLHGYYATKENFPIVRRNLAAALDL